MQRWRFIQLATVIGFVLTAAGCYYRVENYGYSREFGIGKIGCEVASPMQPAKRNMHASPPQWERIVAVTPDSADAPTDWAAGSSQAAGIVNQQSCEPIITNGSPVNSIERNTPTHSVTPNFSETLGQVLPRLAPPNVNLPRRKDGPGQPEKGWVGLPDF